MYHSHTHLLHLEIYQFQFDSYSKTTLSVRYGTFLEQLVCDTGNGTHHNTHYTQQDFP